MIWCIPLKETDSRSLYIFKGFETTCLAFSNLACKVYFGSVKNWCIPFEVYLSGTIHVDSLRMIENLSQ